MSNTFSTRTVCCKLRVDRATDTALRQTQAAFNAAASFCASVAWDQGITNKNTLHHIVYGATRAQFGLAHNWPVVRETKPPKRFVLPDTTTTQPVQPSDLIAVFATTRAPTA